MTIFLIVYFTISTIYALYVYFNSFKTLNHFIANMLFGPLNLLYLIYVLIFNLEDRFY